MVTSTTTTEEQDPDPSTARLVVPSLQQVKEDAAGEGGDGKFHFSVDRGGTFTDVHCILPDGTSIVRKLLSEDPAHYPDAPTEGIRRILAEYDNNDDDNNHMEEHGGASRRYARGQPVSTVRIGSIRMGTTVATNALLERNGAPLAFLVTKGFADILEIGNQARPDIFDLTCKKPSLLYQTVVPIDERIILKQFTSPKFAEQYPEQVGITGESVLIVKEPNLEAIRLQLDSLQHQGITALAICLMHAYVFPEHERRIGALAASMNCFTQISMSHKVMPMVKLVSRGHTTAAAAYLTPKITAYLNSFVEGFDANLSKVPLTFMKSDGGLAPVNDFGGHQAILSGPAAGVVGYAKTAYYSSSSDEDDKLVPRPVIGFDMGGTSTDVSRYDGHWEHVFETVTAGIAIQAPQLDIHTVAAGGGSRLFLKRGMFVVGPESARAHPGPICYRKNGYLAVTDANVVLGRIVPHHFPAIFGPHENEPLDVDGARAAFAALTQLPEAQGRTPEQLAYGFLQVANEAMCRPIRNLTQMKGFDITTHTLACFGGAGPQHACAMARQLGMKRVLVHRYGGVLSAYGLSLADAVHEEQVPAAEIYHRKLSSDGHDKLAALAKKATDALERQGYAKSSIVVERYLNLRYDGTDNAIMILQSDDDFDGTNMEDSFRDCYLREFGFALDGRDLLIDDYRVRAVVPGASVPTLPRPPSRGKPASHETTRTYFEDGWYDVPVYRSEDLLPGHELPGPSIVVQPISIIVLEPHCTAWVTASGDLEIAVGSGNTLSETLLGNDNDGVNPAEIKEDPVQLSIFAHRFMGIAEQMGRTLQRTAISVNMKERLDFSCALFTKDGGLVANAPHIPVHLGAMERAVRFQVEYWNGEDREGIEEGDVLVSNHPQLAGGSHLPDITVITPVFYQGEIIFFVASRGHHADIGGIAPGSMPPHSNRLEDEGAMIIAYKLVKNGTFQEKGITEILQAPGKLPGNSGTRNLRDNLSDLRAQVAANNSGIRLLQELVQECGLHRVEAYMRFIQKNAEISVRRMLQDFVKRHGTTTAHAVDHMDDGSRIELTIDIDPETGSAKFDFTGTDPEVYGNHNAPPAVTYSAVIYSLRCLVAESIPLNQGCLQPIEFVIPPSCLLNPSPTAGVVGGNVLTSQRVVDVVLRAFKACAASQGCMNNLTFGDNKFGYYETIAGGAGAGPTWDGTSGIHTHCTNTRITDPEILERRYPVLLRQFSLRHGSGGRGLHHGGDGVIRELEPLRPLTMSILSERRTLHPYGMAGGEDGACGRNLLVRKDGRLVNLGGRCSAPIDTGECLRIETPGGGGYGTPPSSPEDGAGDSTPPNLVSLIREDGFPRSGLSAHLTPTKRCRLDREGNPTQHHWQGKCNVCKKKSTLLCSVCSDNGKTVYLCGTRKGKACFAQHMQSAHDHEGSVEDDGDAVGEEEEEEEEVAEEEQQQPDVTAALARGRSSSNSSKLGMAGEPGIINVVSLIREDGLPRSGVSAHLTPTKRCRLDREGNPTQHHWQGKCNVCKKKSTLLCSLCSDNGKTLYLCGTRKGKACFAQHMQSAHDHQDSFNK